MPKVPSNSYWRDRCCNPFNKEGHRGKGLRRISAEFRSKYINVPPEALICQNCRKMSYKNSFNSSNASTDDSILEPENNVEEAPEAKKVCLSREVKLEKLMDGLKEKFSSLSVNDPMRVSILTLLPDCWTLRDIMDEFNVSIRMAKKARDLRNESGVLAIPEPKKGKRLSESTVQKVVAYYNSDENSRVMPNKKDVVKIKNGNDVIYVPKRLLLSDIKVLHRNFKAENHEDKISLTMFAQLRPKSCVIAGARGTHSVCVCIIHQNFKAMFEASNLSQLTKGSQGELLSYTDCINYCLCRNPKPNCYLGECTRCPKLSDFKDYITSVLFENDVSEIIFSTWQATDRCTLKKECLDIHDFVSELSDSLKKLIPHHFISKKQSKFISELKNSINEEEGVLEIDYSENHAYVAQNAAQQFHYNNDQCSIFGSVLYYKEGKELKHHSFIGLSGCTTHDTTSVYLAQMHLIPAIREKCPRIKKILYVSDGARQHFKNCYQMINLVHHKDDFGLQAEWHNNATAHGKGSVDGVAAILKSLATRASLQDKGNDFILNSIQLFNWAKQKFPNITFYHYTKQDYDRTSRMLANRFSSAPKVPKISKAHAFKVSSNKTLDAYMYSETSEKLSVTNYVQTK